MGLVLKCVTRKNVLFLCSFHVFPKKTILPHDSYNHLPRFLQQQAFFVRNVTGVSLEMIWPWDFDVRLRSQKPVFHSTLFCIVSSIQRRIRICFQKYVYSLWWPQKRPVNPRKSYDSHDFADIDGPLLWPSKRANSLLKTDSYSL